jgi:hypothetical protein
MKKSRIFTHQTTTTIFTPNDYLLSCPDRCVRSSCLDRCWGKLFPLTLCKHIKDALWPPEDLLREPFLEFLLQDIHNKLWMLSSELLKKHFCRFSLFKVFVVKLGDEFFDPFAI